MFKAISKINKQGYGLARKDMEMETNCSPSFINSIDVFEL